MTSINKIALDTNILIYLYGENEEKRSISELLLAENPLIASQVVSEFINVSKRLLKLPKAELLHLVRRVFLNCKIANFTDVTLLMAEELAGRYNFQVFDAIIVASAIENECNILYSEDMQHNLIIDKKLKIVNPYL